MNTQGHAVIRGGLLAAALILSSCRSATAPQARGEICQIAAYLRDDAARGRSLSTLSANEDNPQVPVVRRLEAIVDERGLNFRMYFHPEQPFPRPFHDAQTPGGWQFQTFLDVDQDPLTGVSGYEFLTRDSEAGLGDGTLVLRRTEGGGGPGGWGDEVARIRVRITSRFVAFTVPLDVIGDDGVVNFSIELYATVLGGEDGQTPIASLVRQYAGSSKPRSVTEIVAASTEAP